MYEYKISASMKLKKMFAGLVLQVCAFTQV